MCAARTSKYAHISTGTSESSWKMELKESCCKNILKLKVTKNLQKLIKTCIEKIVHRC